MLLNRIHIYIHTTQARQICIDSQHFLLCIVISGIYEISHIFHNSDKRHIHHDTKNIEYNRGTQYLKRSMKQIDEYTVEDEWHIMDKSEEMMRLEELTRGGIWGDDDGIIFGGAEA